MGLTYKPDLLKTMAPDEDMTAIDLLSTLKISLGHEKVRLLEILGARWKISTPDASLGQHNSTAKRHNWHGPMVTDT